MHAHTVAKECAKKVSNPKAKAQILVVIFFKLLAKSVISHSFTKALSLALVPNLPIVVSSFYSSFSMVFLSIGG